MTVDRSSPSVTPSADVPIDEEPGRYSKAMMRLEPVHRAFVEELFNMQTRDFAKAYVLARASLPVESRGRFSDKDMDPNSHSAIVMGSRWAHREDVKEAIFSEGARRMTAYVPMIMEMLSTIALDPSHKDAARVGLGILDRTGFGPTKKIDQTLSVSGETTALLKIDITDPKTAVAVRKFAEALNLNGDDFAKHLGTELAKRAGLPSAPVLPTTDAEFEEVQSRSGAPEEGHQGGAEPPAMMDFVA